MNLYVAVRDNLIRKISNSGQVSTFVTGLNHPSGMVINQYNELFLADAYNKRILKINNDGTKSDFIIGLSNCYKCNQNK